jgi:hypothetical protein
MSTIAFGEPPYAMNVSHEKAEFDSALMEARQIIFLDNLNVAKLQSNLLATALAEPHFQVRILGYSKLLSITSRALVVVTGNGVGVAEDLLRRFLTIELDPQTEHPENRRFNPGFSDWIKATRTGLLSDALTIFRWGRQNNSNIKPGESLGSYETWCSWVRDPLVALGCSDPIDRIRRLKMLDPDRQNLAAMFTQWNLLHGSNPVPVSKLDPSVCDLINPHWRGRRQAIVTTVPKFVNARAAGFLLTQHVPEGKWSPTTYALKRTDPPQ